MGKKRYAIIAAMVVIIVAAIALWPRIWPRVVALIPATTNTAVTEAADEIIETDDTITVTPKTPNGRLAVYLHGAGQPFTAAITDPETSSLTAALVEEGYVVVAADAAGNAWGNDASVAAYEQLIEDTAAEYGTSSIYLIAESMGALAAAQLNANAWAAIYPVCDVSSITKDSLEEQIATVYPDGAPSNLSPIAWPETPSIVWASPDDTMVSAADNAFTCADDVIETEGEHGDKSNFDPERLVAFFAKH